VKRNSSSSTVSSVPRASADARTVDREPLDGVPQVRVCRPPRPGEPRHEVHDPPVEAVGQEGGHEARLVLAVA
jgi:hypothetical protein